VLRTADETGARRLVERLAVALQGSLPARHAPGPVADALAAGAGAAYGTLPAGLDLRSIIERNLPIVELTTA
jgi:putative acyl-CoA dehydrogenase